MVAPNQLALEVRASLCGMHSVVSSSWAAWLARPAGPSIRFLLVPKGSVMLGLGCRWAALKVREAPPGTVVASEGPMRFRLA